MLRFFIYQGNTSKGGSGRLARSDPQQQLTFYNFVALLCVALCSQLWRRQHMRKQAWRTFFRSWCPTLGSEPFLGVHNSLSRDLNKEKGASTACFSEYLARRESRPAVLHSPKGISNTVSKPGHEPQQRKQQHRGHQAENINERLRAFPS